MYYVGSADVIIYLCWGTQSLLLSTLVLRYCFKLLHAWIVYVPSRTVLCLVKLFFCYLSLSFYLYFFRGGKVLFSLNRVYVILRLSCVVYINQLFWKFYCFDLIFEFFTFFLIWIIFLPLFDVDWESFMFVLFSFLSLVYGVFSDSSFCHK